MKIKILFILFFPFILFAQNNQIDSLKSVLNIENLKLLDKSKTLHKLSLLLADVNPEEANQYNQLHFSIAKKHLFYEQLGAAYNIKGILSRNKGEYDVAISNFIKALQVYDSLKITNSIAMIYNNIGVTHMYNEVYEEAIIYYNKALKLATEIKDTNVIKMTINNLGIIYCYQGEFKDGVNYFKKSLNIELKLNNKKGEAECLSNIGAAFYYLEKLDSALYYFESALKIEKQLNDVVGIAGSLINLGELYTQTGDFDKAESYLNEAITITKQHNIASEYQDGLFNLGALFEQKGDFEQALMYQRKFQNVRDSVLSATKSEQIAEMQTKYETEKKEKQIAEQKKELALKEARVQRRNLQLVLLGGGVFVIIIIAVGIYTIQKSKQEKLQQQVALEKAEAINKVQHEKLRISRDLHDNIGSQLTFVISTLDNMNYIKDEEKRNEKLNQLSGFTRDTMNQLRETIWAIKSESITLEQLNAKVGEFIDKAKIACPNINFKLKTTKDNFTFNSNQAINVYRTIQEAVNNAIKYANAENIEYVSDANGIALKDDGIGFDITTTKASNGLVNMQLRMQEVGFKTDILSKVGEGTKISITLS